MKDLLKGAKAESCQDEFGHTFYRINLAGDATFVNGHGDEKLSKALRDELLKAIELYQAMQIQPFATLPLSLCVPGSRILANDGSYFFEAEYDGEDWCSLGGDDVVYWMPLPPNPTD